jgi:hypothetical protein
MRRSLLAFPLHHVDAGADFGVGHVQAELIMQRRPGLEPFWSASQRAGLAQIRFRDYLSNGRSARRCGAAPAFRANGGIQVSWIEEKNKSMSGRPALVRERELNKALSAALKVGAKEVRVDLGGGVSITIPLPAADEKPVAPEEQIRL